ncbi:hypothetical protein NM208_g4515 [Fusarium decemcellulare]|uniref:Uncharacterized protein n=1 Tax=Fusarium decemcellulare TaxID=57161 RepID=A0ACC1SKJ0_9HYPO|nr:hypothetical protein NM208_g4515 [Fusarium decemcellulare]
MSLPDSVWKNAYDMVGEALAADATDVIFSEPRPKRRKTQLACNCCRVRKTRCDGGRPVCFACEKRGSIQDCLYEEGALKTRQYIQKLETRLKQLEKGRGSQHGRSEDGSRPHVPGRPAGDMTQSRWTGRAGSPSQVESPDGLATVSASLHRHNLLYGESSTIAFVEHVLLTTGSTDEIDGGSSVSEDNSGASIHTMGQSGLKTDHPESLDVLPIRRNSDRYLQSFWNIVHPVFPILHRPTFTRFYASLWESTSSVDTDTTSDDPILGGRALQADQFYERARRLVPIDTLDVASLPIVQMLLLTAVHLQSTMYSSRCWNMVGLAIRVAQSLGLHLNQKSATQNQLEREMQRRIWYTCVTLDRPAMLSQDSQVPLPQMIDDEYLLEDGEGTQPEDSPCRMGLFIYTVRLLDILSEVLGCFYAEAGHAQKVSADKNQQASMPDLHEMLRLNSKLDQFLEAIPTSLRLKLILRNSEPPSGSALLQARILYCRFLYTRLLLLRPVILLLARSASDTESESIMPEQNSLRGEVAERMCQICLDTAHELISVLHQDMGSTYRSSAWWTVYFTFCAATVVLASLPHVTEEVPTASMNTSLSLAMAILKHYTSEVASSAQAMQVIETLRDRLSSVHNTGTSTPPSCQASEDVDQDPGALSGFTFGNAEGYIPGLTPDPLSEDWFSHEAMRFNFQEFLQELR